MKSPWPPRTVLGAVPPGEAYCSVGDPPYWMACMTRAEEGGESHVYFISSAAAPRLLCFACRPETESRDRVHPPEEQAPEAVSAITPVLSRPPWGDAAPIWKSRLDKSWLEEEWNERAGIMQHDGGLSRPQAEHAAYRLVLAMA